MMRRLHHPAELPMFHAQHGRAGTRYDIQNIPRPLTNPAGVKATALYRWCLFAAI